MASQVGGGGGVALLMLLVASPLSYAGAPPSPLVSLPSLASQGINTFGLDALAREVGIELAEIAGVSDPVYTSAPAAASGYSTLGALLAYHMPESSSQDSYCIDNVRVNGRCGRLYYIEIRLIYFPTAMIWPMVRMMPARSGLDNDVSKKWVPDHGPTPDVYSAYSETGPVQDFYLVGFQNYNWNDHVARANYRGYEPDADVVLDPGKLRLDPWMYVYPPPGTSGERRFALEVHGGRRAAGSPEDRLKYHGTAGCIRVTMADMAALGDAWENHPAPESGQKLFLDYTSPPDCPFCDDNPT